MIKAAIIGLGWWGKIITSLVEKSDQLQIIGAVELNQAAGQAFCKERGLRLYDSYEAVLADPQIDAVILTTPHRFHVDQIIAAANAGKHVFCEKPLSLTLDSAVRAVKACRKNGVRLGVGHERRYEPPVQMVRGLLDDGTLGILLQIEGNFSQNKFVALSPDNWRLSRAEAACGPMTATGIHLLDFAVSLGGGADRVFARNNTLATTFESGDSLSTVIELRNGATATINAMLATPFYGRLTVFGSKGWVEIRDKSHVEAPTGWTVVKRIGDQDPVTIEYPAATPVLSNLDAFARSIGGRQEDYPMSMQDMLNTVSAFEAVFKSTLTGQIETAERISISDPG
jgi:predicted dehydrogenase